MTCATIFPRWSISSSCFHINSVPRGTAVTWTSPRFSIQGRVNLMLRQLMFFSVSLSVVKNNSRDPTIIIWIIAAPGVISQDCSPLAGGTSHKNGKVVPQRAPHSLGQDQQRRSVMGMESEGSRPPSSLGHREGRLGAHLWPRWVRLARHDCVLKANWCKEGWTTSIPQGLFSVFIAD